MFQAKREFSTFSTINESCPWGATHSAREFCPWGMTHSILFIKLDIILPKP